MTEDVGPEMSPIEFQRLGYLLEVNRQFLHPLGLSLAITQYPDGHADFSVLDYRDDREGMTFDELDADDRQKIARIAAEAGWRRPSRIARLGYWIQGEAL